MKKEIAVKYSFEANGKVLDRNSEELKRYEAHFEEKILPKIKEVERKKTESRNIAYQLKVSFFASETTSNKK